MENETQVFSFLKDGTLNVHRLLPSRGTDWSFVVYPYLAVRESGKHVLQLGAMQPAKPRGAGEWMLEKMNSVLCVEYPHNPQKKRRIDVLTPTTSECNLIWK